MKRVLSILFAVLVLVGLLLFFGALVRGLTMGALVTGLIYWGLVRPYDKKRRLMREVSDRAFGGLPGFPNEQTWLVADSLNKNDAFHDDVCSLARRDRDAHDLGLRIRVYVGEHFEPALIDDLSAVHWDAIGAAWLARAGEAKRSQD
jgi:hypothetical protein